MTMNGLLSLEESDFENVNEFNTDKEFYKTALSIAYDIPAESTLRGRLDSIGISLDLLGN